MAYTKTIEQLQGALQERINEQKAEIDALKSIQVNTNHKTLTNRAITGDRAQLSTKSYSINGSKELHISYKVGNKYQTTTVDASEYTGETVGCIKQSRTITPKQLQDRIDGIVKARESELAELERDYKNASSIIRNYNHIVALTNELENSVTWATRAVLR